MTNRPGRILTIIGPGMLVAATGVGAGDLATAAFTGSKLGLTILWAVIVGAILKYTLNEGLARWQLVTNQTLLEGCASRFGRPVLAIFLLYFLVWSYLVAAALMSACGVTAQSLLPISDDPTTGKIIYGLAHSAIGVALIFKGGYKFFEKFMHCCIFVMFLTVVTTAILLTRDWSAVAMGILSPGIPDFAGDGRDWTLALLGGVGGTVTVLCYGYWIREEKRTTASDLSVCRWDLAAGYTMTALFGLSMVVIGSTVQIQGRGAGLIIDLATSLEKPLGPLGKWIFLVGAWGAVASSLLGVWQSVPYLFADTWSILTTRPGTDRARVSDTTTAYRVFLCVIATTPAIGLWTGFAQTQKLYGIIGAAFMPMLALTLLILNARRSEMGEHRNQITAMVLLVITLLFFTIMFGSKVYSII